MVETHGRANSPEEVDQHKTESETKEFRDTWTFRLSIAYDILTALLVIIGATGVNAALRTLRAIEKQTSTMIESQRPWLTIMPRGDPIPAIAAGNPINIVISVKNVGPTAALDMKWETWIELVPEPFLDFSPAAKHFLTPSPMTIYPNAPTPSTFIIAADRPTREQLATLQGGTLILCWRIRMEYGDAFGKRRYQNFAFAVQKQGMSVLPKYNDSN